MRTDCGDAARMRELLEGTLPEAEQARLEAHLEGCEACRRAFDAVAAEGRFWDDLRRYAGPGRAPSRPEEDLDDEPLHFLEPDASPGRIGRFGRYEVLEVLGRGGMGVVLKTFDPGLHRVAAIKVLSPRLATSASARRRFDREARAAASVAHEHVVTIHAVDEVDGLPYLVMQYVAGRSLQQRIDRDGPLELEAILRIGMQAAAGLAAAHAQGLVHRDVKPANILLENGIERVKLTDFGLARAVDDASLTQSGVVAGTPQYMAPEQARGESVDHRADLFSLGSVLYAMCTGRSPFRAETTVAVLKRVCDDTPRPIREVNATIPEWLAAIVARLHAKDPADRFQSAAEVAEVLGRHLARLQQPTTTVVPAPAITPVVSPRPAPDPDFDDIPAAKEPAPLKALWRGLQWARAIVGLLVGLLILLVLLVILSEAFSRWIERGEPATATESSAGPIGPAAVSADGKLGPARSDTIVPIWAVAEHAGSVKSLAISRDGRFGLSGSGYPSGDATARLWDLQTGRELRQVGDTFMGQVLGVALSPDGRQALTCGQSPTVRLWDVDTGRGIRRLEGHPGAVNAVALSPDGHHAVSAGIVDALVRMWDLETGRELRRLEGHTAGVYCVAWSPDGRFVLSGSEDRTVRLWDAATGREIRKLTGMTRNVESVAFSPDGRLALAGGQDGVGRLWEVETGRELRRLIGHQGIIAGVAFVPGGSRALTVSPSPERVSGDGTMRLWDLETGREVARVVSPGGTGFWSVVLPPDGLRAITGGTDGSIRMWRLPALGPSLRADVSGAPEAMPGEVRILRGHLNWIEAVAAPADGRFAITGGNDCTLRQWDLPTGRARTLMSDPPHAISDVAISDDGRFAITGGLGRVVNFWDLQSGHRVPLTGHRRKVRAVAISRDGRFGLSGSEEEALRYWDLAQARELRQLEGHTKGTCSVALSPDGRLGLSGSVDATARLWDLEKGSCLGVLAEGGPWVSAVAFMPDGRRAIIGRQDGTLGLHDVGDGREIRRFAGHRTYIRNVQASRDGRLILSAGTGALRLWDAATGEEVYQLQGVGGGIVCGIILPGSREVLFGCYDTTVRLWRLPDSIGGPKGR
jgi:serine/threonine-protein kinase